MSAAFGKPARDIDVGKYERYAGNLERCRALIQKDPGEHG